MQIGIIGLGWMGSKIAHRLLRAGLRCVVYDRRREAVEALAREGATGFGSAAELVASLSPPRVLWLMLPADAVDKTLELVGARLQAGDTVVDAGNSRVHDDRRRARALAARGAAYVDVGISGPDDPSQGYCLMVGGPPDAVSRLVPIFETLAPRPPAVAAPDSKLEAVAPTRSYLHCGPSGAGHFVKMVHDGIERGVMEAYAEGLNILRRANVGTADDHPRELDVPAIAEMWRHGSVIQSVLLDIAAAALAHDPDLIGWGKRAADLGASRRAIDEALGDSVDARVLASIKAKRTA